MCGTYNHKGGGTLVLVDYVICICAESFQDAEKDFLYFYRKMGIMPFSSKAFCYNTDLIRRHYLISESNLHDMWYWIVISGFIF